MSVEIARKLSAANESPAPSSTVATQPGGTPAAAALETMFPSSRSEMDADLAGIATGLAEKIRECQAFSVGWLIKAGEILCDYRSQLPHGDMTTIFASGWLPLGQRSAQMLTRIARNRALRDLAMLQRLPQSIAALEILAALDARSIEQGVRDGSIHPQLTVKATRALIRKQRTQSSTEQTNPKKG